MLTVIGFYSFVYTLAYFIFCEESGMDWKSRYEVTVILVGFKSRFGRAVLLHFPTDNGDAGSPAFSHVQFFQEVANPPVPISSVMNKPFLNLLHFGTSVWTSLIDDLNTIR